MASGWSRKTSSLAWLMKNRSAKDCTKWSMELREHLVLTKECNDRHGSISCPKCDEIEMSLRSVGDLYHLIEANLADAKACSIYHQIGDF